MDQHKTTDGASLSLHPDAEPGFFSIRYGGALLLDHAFIRVETETGLVASPDKRFTLTQGGNALFFRDTRKECDLVFQWKMEEGGSLDCDVDFFIERLGSQNETIIYTLLHCKETS